MIILNLFITLSSQGSNWSEEDRGEIPLDDVNHALSLPSRGAVSPLKHKTRSSLTELHPSSIWALKRKATYVVLALLDSITPGQGTKLLQLIHVPPQDLTLNPLHILIWWVPSSSCITQPLTVL